jgi:hypothetical protein
MTEAELKEAIKDFPLGTKLQILKKNGNIIEVTLSSHEVSGTEAIDYGNIVVPALPPAITVHGGTRFGNHRLDAADIVKIVRLE